MSGRTKAQNRALWRMAQMAKAERHLVGWIVEGVTGGRTEHTSELTEAEADEVIEQLRTLAEARGARCREDSQEGKARKRLIGAVYGWLERNGRHGATMDYVKEVICRAAKAEEINKIDLATLARLYNYFNKKK